MVSVMPLEFAVFLAESVAVKTSPAAVAAVLLGVPETTPAELKDNPAGSVPVESVHV
jgi:hypothetical protein